MKPNLSRQAFYYSRVLKCSNIAIRHPDFSWLMSSQLRRQILQDHSFLQADHKRFKVLLLLCSSKCTAEMLYNGMQWFYKSWLMLLSTLKVTSYSILRHVYSIYMESLLSQTKRVFLFEYDLQTGPHISLAGIWTGVDEKKDRKERIKDYPISL